ncbi:vexin isoform X2 [Monodelphis domestica]|uniref:Vexin n=1 Tax=Monodelphis domestica TaxID=13616 RepID=F6UTN9_MONDO|nr:vexin isoform X2 [Monodelphis domestica]
MHQIYSCSDENLEVFTTVISSKVSSPARRKVKISQHLLTKSVVAVTDYHIHRPLELLPHRTERLQVLCREGEERRFGRLQNGTQGQPLAKNTARHVGIPDPKPLILYGNRAYGKSLIPQTSLSVPRITVKQPPVSEVAAAEESGRTLTKEPRRLPRKMPEDDPAFPQGAEASVPLTGRTSCGTPNILRKMWLKHKKKSEYLGATNCAFEAD